ncbi:hypothetical protein ACXZ9C_11150 [Streptococcus agalactiae]
MVSVRRGVKSLSVAFVASSGVIAWLVGRGRRRSPSLVVVVVVWWFGWFSSSW